MSVLLDQPAIRARVHRVSLEHYHHMGDEGLVNEKHELLDGYIIEKMSKSPRHERIKQKLVMMLMRTVTEMLTVRTEGPLSIGNSEPEPDISVVKGTPDDWIDAHPNTAELVIEVAISSIETDLEKARIYAAAAIPEYWVVRPEDGQIDVFRNPSDGNYTNKTTVSGNEALISSAIAGFTLIPAELFAVRK
jgi:Uma2 family endonuclease